MMITRALAGLALVAGLAACGTKAPEPAASADAVPAALTVRDPWVKAAGKGEMTAAFGTLVNSTGKDVTVVKAASDASPMELHEMVMQNGSMIMRPKQGGFVIKAGGTHDLSPGGDHLMLMSPARAIEPGDQVSFVLTLADGATTTFTAVAKPFAGAGESYAPSAMPSMG